MTGKKHRNIPIFIPHLGCPNLCVFCNQRSISGCQKFERESVISEIEEALSTIPCDCEVEIAYFGGSFTGIDRELMIYLLDVAKSYVCREDDGRAKVVGIRMSTRPDYINDEIMDILSYYPIKTIELGLQSMSDEVLLISKRGHTSRDAERACKLICERGIDLVGQMMIGLPGGSLENELETAKRICDMGASGARIYPTVVFYDTELADMAERGEYQPIALDDAIYRSKEVLKIFLEHNVECIRIGICASDNLFDEEKVMGGANHAALGELVIGELYYDEMCDLLALYGNSSEGKIAKFSVPVGEISKAVGQSKKNKQRLIEKYKLRGLKITEHNAQTITLALE